MPEEPTAELTPEDEAQLPELAEAEFPPYVRTEPQRRRWRLCVGTARRIMEGEDEAQIWQLTRSLYASNITT